VPLKEAWDRAVAGTIHDAKTALGILRARAMLEGGLLPPPLQ
jgi:hypothetical protein